MTAIACYIVEGVPAIMGDLLISGPEILNRKVSLPTIGAVENFFPEGSGWTITGSAQKVVIVSEECGLAWAGSQLAARIVLKELAQFEQGRRLTKELIDQFLKNIDPEVEQLGLSLVGCVVEDGVPHQFAYCADEPFYTDAGVKVVTAGSGSKHLASALRTRFRAGYNQDGRSAHAAERAFEAGIGIGGQLLRTERPSGWTLREYFGGGYEVAVFNGEHFTKDFSVTYILWDAKIPDRKWLAHPTRVISYQYDGGILLLRTQELRELESGKFTFGEISIGLVRPVYPHLPFTKPISPELFTEDIRWICHCFMANVAGRVAPYSLVERQYPHQAPYTSLTNSNGIIIRIDIKGPFWMDIMKQFDALHAAGSGEEAHWGLAKDLDLEIVSPSEPQNPTGTST